MIDCPFDDCLSFEADATLAVHLLQRHLEGIGPADELSIEQLAEAIDNLTTQSAVGMELLQVPRAREVLERAALTARPEAALSLAVVVGLEATA